MMRHKYFYGDHPSQWGELFIPENHGAKHPGFSALADGVAVVIHGGYWRSQYGAELGEPIARDLAARGIPAWNLEYRRAGNGGGWPHTFEDVLAGIDHLSDIAEEHGLKLGKVVALGHSAGGHLAVWAAGRRRLSSIGAQDAERQLQRNPEETAVHLTGVVSQSGLLNLAEAERLNLSNGAVCNLMGGDSVRYPKRHRFADPMSTLPIDVPVFAVHAADDDDVPVSQSEGYVAASTASGGTAQLLRVPGDHYDLIDTKSVSYKKCRELVQRLLA
ncbi:alpha/beta hydrolase [Arthrobacter sp. CJ23]|uniref:alpha/beta hydrolase n=1 Tax=Arthrobacter sp. CJ23 TaxID=2972479 RepID=UPI00215CDDAD|nr:alpha/beta hydrolase [Arthrobacter sp. CJ23]UVJ39676.1 alpha/beta hydrolase [Arthrobacter sp. CJ23]